MTAKKALIVEICPNEPRASMCLRNGKSVIGSKYEGDVLDCTGSGDCEPACDFLRVVVGVEFRIVAQNAMGEYENRLATDAELTATAKAIYFESDADFEDDDVARTYLIWEAANGVANEETAD